jgi:hypothetical protein
LGAGILKGNRLLPFLLALILIAFALGSLPRTQPGGSLLLGSYWLVYLSYLLPLIGLGLIIVMLGFMILHWRHLSDSIGYQLSRKRAAKRKQSRKIEMAAWLAAWTIAAYILTAKCGGIFCRAPSPAAGLPDTLNGFVSGSGPGPTLPLLSTIANLSSLVQSDWFYLAFLGFLVVTSVIIARGVLVSWQETRADAISQMPLPRAEGVVALEDALRILKTQPELDPRTRIINCYERMVQAARAQGATVTSDQTARELETSIRKMLVIRGPAIRELTNLFEEARYSLHNITENDAEQAQGYLHGIAEEMNIPLSV